ncbi:DUF6309 family protein [Streptomyces paludis]|uniref:DUF6309 family protein n=1 Tax=Streptomyces paludis TaxID=2282738 RepID=UPI0015F2C438|nr:DUF6309 family protein [Streptomyces paludis]
MVQIIGPVTFDEVLTAFRRDHPVARDHAANTNQDAENMLSLADRLFGGWSKARLSRAELRAVILPWHLSEGGARELVPRTGLTVGEAADLLRAHAAELSAANPLCTEKIARFRAAPFTSVYFSRGPVTHDDYADLRTGEGLVHLDGLHRLLAWELSGRLSARPAREDDGPIAYLAGVPDPNAAPGGRRP